MPEYRCVVDYDVTMRKLLYVMAADALEADALAENEAHLDPQEGVPQDVHVLSVETTPADPLTEAAL